MNFLSLLSSAKSDSFLLLDSLQMLSSKKSDLLDDESEDDGSDSGSPDTCAFTFLFEESVGCVDNSVGRGGESVGRVCGVGSGVFVPI